MGYGLDCRGSIPGKGKIFVVSTASRLALEAIHPMGTGGCYPGAKRWVRETDRLPPTSAEVKNGGAIPPPRIHLHGIMVN
jgi:hypothetical protein